MRLHPGYFCVIFLSFLCTTANADFLTDFRACRAEPESAKRLTCFDSVTLPDMTRASTHPATSPITITKAELRLQEVDYIKGIFRQRLELAPSFKNTSDKTIVAFEFKLTVANAFGHRVIDVPEELDIRIAPGSTVAGSQLYIWEDNQFAKDEPFDQLLGPVKTGVAKTTIHVTRAVFSDGTDARYH